MGQVCGASVEDRLGEHEWRLGPGRSVREGTGRLMVRSELGQQVESEGVGMGASRVKGWIHELGHRLDIYGGGITRQRRTVLWLK